MREDKVAGSEAGGRDAHHHNQRGKAGNAGIRTSNPGGEGGANKSTRRDHGIRCKPRRPQIDPVPLGAVEIDNAVVAAAGVIDEDVRAGAAGQRIVAAEPPENIVTALAFQNVVAAMAGDDVVEFGAAHGADAADADRPRDIRIVADGSVAIGGSRAIRAERDHNAAGRMIEGDAGIAIAGDGIVTTAAFKFIGRGTAAIGPGTAGIGQGDRRRRHEPGRIVGIVKIRSPDGFDRTQRVGASVDSAGHGAGRQIDDNAGVVGGTEIIRAVEAAAAIDRVVAAEPFEIFVGQARVVAAGERIVEERAANLVDAGEMVGADRAIAGRRAGSAPAGIGGRVPAVGIECHGHA